MDRNTLNTALAQASVKAPSAKMYQFPSISRGWLSGRDVRIKRGGEDGDDSLVTGVISDPWCTRAVTCLRSDELQKKYSYESKPETYNL